jgi:GcrA cell cycle regulator
MTRASPQTRVCAETFGQVDSGEETMQSTWKEEHSEALRQHLAGGMSFSEAADAINAKFRTDYTRSAAIGRAKRMGLPAPRQRDDRPKSLASGKAPRSHKPFERYAFETWRIMPAFETETLNLRCVEIVPRYLSLIDLETGDCRYPYGGDEEGQAITFCGHPQRPGTSYCTPHFHLTRGPGTPSERAAGNVSLRLVAA